MARVKHAPKSRKRKKKMFKQTKGYWGQRKNVYRRAKETLLRALHFSYIHRRRKKRDFRTLWNIRINSALKDEGCSYSKFISLLRKKNVQLNRKVLSEIAIMDPEGFKEIVQFATS
jgi:large subunit ribosomal protein L20